MKQPRNFDAPKLSHGAEEIFQHIEALPIVSPHGHCEPSWFAENDKFADPAELLIIPDHYVFRMLYSQGITLDQVGIGVPKEDRNPREIFRLLANNWHLFAGTPSKQWLSHTLVNVFGITDKLSGDTADLIYDRIDEKISDDAFRPRALFKRFDIELLATTDGALDDLKFHHANATGEDPLPVIPTFRPDSVLNPSHSDFHRDLNRLGEICNLDVGSYSDYIDAIRARRAFFVENGATATDHAITDLTTQWLPQSEVENLFAKARDGNLSDSESARFYGHMIVEMAQMSLDDGLVLQLHVGSERSTNISVFEKYGPDKGADIPKRVDWVSGLDGLLNRVGNNPKLGIIAFTLDEGSYARELAPMAGHWPALKLGPPWWFHDSLNGIRRYFDQVVETAGYWNLTGFNDDTRAFMSIPARHDLWRRAVAIHLSEQIEKDIMDKEEANRIAQALARDLALDAYNIKRV